MNIVSEGHVPIICFIPYYQMALIRGIKDGIENKLIENDVCFCLLVQYIPSPDSTLQGVP